MRRESSRSGTFSEARAARGSVLSAPGLVLAPGSILASARPWGQGPQPLNLCNTPAPALTETGPATLVTHFRRLCARTPPPAQAENRDLGPLRGPRCRRAARFVYTPGSVRTRSLAAPPGPACSRAGRAAPHPPNPAFHSISRSWRWLPNRRKQWAG